MTNTKMFQPKAGYGDVIFIEDYGEYYLVVAEPEPLAAYIKDFGSISAGGKLEQQELNFLELEKGFLAQIRVLPIDDVNVYIRPTMQTVRGALKKAVFYIPKWITDNTEYHELAEIWQREDHSYYADIEDATGSGVSTSRVLFVGWLYKVKKIEEAEAEGRRIVRVRIATITMGATT